MTTTTSGTAPSRSVGRLPAPVAHAVRVGARRGVTEFRISLRNPEDLMFYLGWGGGVLLYLVLNRDALVEGTSITVPALAMPGLLAAMLVFGGVLGPAFALVLEREDGTLLRAKAAPHGMTGYVSGQVVLQALGMLPMLAVILLPSVLFLGVDMHRGLVGWLALTATLALGLVATLPIGMVIGSVARKPNQVSTWGMLPVLAMGAVSGIFVPLTQLATWMQVVGQVFPMYWLGHVMRWAFLPEEASVLEPGGEWRILEAVGVLGLWTAVGLLLAPRVLRRMARRESGSAVEARKQERMQRIG
ncbi:ABC transporter permease [Actinotalea ferrariae]|uniref:ABC transporter permease n=1 Tax=Actinotalea ferrariae TaxID=1386098 RepID=UPI001C8C202F|nr:ABC transporter permease [Actinotalea ferrariae]MBX9245304.1 ABC transporter permease [Actinotalea ferrariae]